MAHVLIVGGTGILRAVSCFLAEKGNIVTVVARDEEKLHELSCMVAAQGVKINPVSVDYNDLEEFDQKLTTAIQTYGPFQLSLTWISSNSRPAFYRLANFLNRTSPVCRLFHVCNSEWVKELNHSNEIETRLALLNRVYYRKILLGNGGEINQNPWLTHDELSSGIIQALSMDARVYVIGNIEPFPGQVLSA